ncbi:hypothetical protein OG723_44475 (plasmid) [Streptomyces sp. NBC_01278]|uniref:hypothetical protein n=1 Tax=Streptomyces sp. NBC_01278 TaxID=2903809 RepID=UPI002E365518|nr:hypothetical protein [Streptomyces sp. NBC_01278]
MTTAPALTAPAAALQVAGLLPAGPLTPWQAEPFRTGYADAPAARITDGSRTVIVAFHTSHTTLSWARRGESPTFPLVAVPSTDPRLIAREILRSVLPNLDVTNAPEDDRARPARNFVDELDTYFTERHIPTGAYTAHGDVKGRIWQRGPALLLLESHMHEPTLRLHYQGLRAFHGGTLADLEALLQLIMPPPPRRTFKVIGTDITGAIPRRLYAQLNHASIRQHAPYDALSFGRNFGPEGQIETPDYRARARDDSPVHATVGRLGLDFVRNILTQLTDPNA